MLAYTGSTYHRRSVYALARRYEQLVCGRALHIGGARDFWLLRGAESVTSVELSRREGIDVVGDALNLPFQDASFESVVALEVLEHVREPAAMVREIRRVLKPGGHVFLSTPFVWKIHRAPKDYWRFTDDSLEMLFEDFGDCKVYAVNGARETLMHVIYQFAEVFLDRMRLPRSFLLALKPAEWVTFAAIPAEHNLRRMWTTGWLVIAEK